MPSLQHIITSGQLIHYSPIIHDNCITLFISPNLPFLKDIEPSVSVYPTFHLPFLPVYPTTHLPFLPAMKVSLYILSLTSPSRQQCKCPCISYHSPPLSVSHVIVSVYPITRLPYPPAMQVSLYILLRTSPS